MVYRRNSNYDAEIMNAMWTGRGFKWKEREIGLAWVKISCKMVRARGELKANERSRQADENEISLRPANFMLNTFVVSDGKVCVPRYNFNGTLQLQ